MNKLYNMEKKSRIFITAAIADSMLDKVAQLGKTFEVTYVDLEELVGLDLISGIKSKPLLGTLREMGIDVKQCPEDFKFILESGDILYVINPNGKVKDLNGDKLPETYTLTAKKYIIN